MRQPPHCHGYPQRTQSAAVIRATPAPEWMDHGERGSRRLLRVMAFLSLRVGRRASRGILYLIALYFFLFAPVTRRNSDRYLRLALNRAPRAIDCFRQIMTFATTIHDRVYLINEQFRVFKITLEGEGAVLENALQGRGAMLLGAHMGSFEVIHTLGQRHPALRVAMAMYADNAQKISSTLAAINPHVTPDIIALGRIDAMLQIAERLDQGFLVGVLADRSLREEAVQQVSLLGRPAYLPIGPMRAAAMLRQPVFFMAGLYRGGNHYHIVFRQIADFSVPIAGERSKAVTAAIHRYAATLDEYCRSDPYNWFNFFDFWRQVPRQAGSQ